MTTTTTETTTTTATRSTSPSTEHPSFPHAFKSRYYVERGDGWDATVKVDYDGRNPLSIRKIMSAKKMIDRLRLVATRAEVSRTKKGHHLRVWLRSPHGRPVPARTILRLQAVFGDDPMRQKFNTARVRRDEPGWNVLFTCKYRNGILLYREEADAEKTIEVCKTLNLCKVD